MDGSVKLFQEERNRRQKHRRMDRPAQVAEKPEGGRPLRCQVPNPLQ